MTFDWSTFALQTVNILILIWILGRFFWRPVAAMIAARRQQAQDMLDAAQRDREAAARILAEARKREDGFAQEREAVLTQARQEAAAARQNLLDQARAEADQLGVEARAALARRRDEAEQEWTRQAIRLAVTIAGKLAARLDGAEVKAAFLHGLVEKLAEPSGLAGPSIKDDGVELISAAPLDPAEQAQVAAALTKALGATPRIAFSVDPALIAGLELKSPHFALSNNWRADLDQISAELSHDRHD